MQSVPRNALNGSAGSLTGRAEGITPTVQVRILPRAIMNQIEIILPPPPKALRPNARPNRFRKAEATKQYRGCAHIAAKAQMNELRWPKPPHWERATIEAIFIVRTNRHRDRDNLLASLKAAFDGLADSRLIANDRGLTFLPVKIVLNVNAKESVHLIVTKGE